MLPTVFLCLFAFLEPIQKVEMRKIYDYFKECRLHKEPDMVDRFSNETERFQQCYLEGHNMYRKIHDAPPMKLDEKLSDEAASIAKSLAESPNYIPPSLIVLKDDWEGVNVQFECTPANAYDNVWPKLNFAMNKWYREVCVLPGYDFEKRKGFSTETEHFTQLVWKESKELGIGRAKAERPGLNCVYVVAKYSPVGNKGDFEENVSKGSFDHEKHCVKPYASWAVISDLL